MNVLQEAIQQLPAGRYAIGTSAGVDSTALVRLLARRTDCEMVLVHLNHELRGADSEADAEFVATLARDLNLSSVIERRSAVETTMTHHLANPAAHYRAVRLALFRRVIAEHSLNGVVLAHHADDQAETVLLRLLRGGGLLSLGGMSARRVVDGAVIYRPLLNVTKSALIGYLNEIYQPWREDLSNQSNAYVRNTVRQLLSDDNDLTGILLRLAAASRRVRSALDSVAPELASTFACDRLRLPRLVAEYSARRWFRARGAPADAISSATCRRLILQALDVRQPPRQHYPGGILVRRRQKCIDVMPVSPLQSARSHGKEQTKPASEF